MTKIRPIGRTTAIFAAMALGIAGLAACSNDNSGSTDKPTPESGIDEKPAAAGEVVMWSRAPLERQAKNAVDAYNASHDSKIKLEILPNDDVEGKVGAAVQTDTLPCLLAGDVVRVPYWTQQGVFMDINDRIDALPELKDLAVGHIDAGTYEGKKHTLPFVTDISVMVWNKALYEKAGLDPEQGPTTIKEFVEHSKAVAAVAGEGESGTYLSGQSGGALVFTLFPSMWASGVEVINADGTKAEVDSDPANAVYEAYRELNETANGLGAGSQEETGATWTAPFAEGRVGVMPYPFTAVTGMFEGNAFDVGVSGIPGTESGKVSTFLGGDALGISSSCGDVDAAWDFMSWLMTAEAQQEVFADNNDTASNLKVLADGYKDADPRTLIANDTIQYGRTPVAVNFNEAFNAAGSPWQLLVQNAVFGSGDSLAADNEAVTAILSQK